MKLLCFQALALTAVCTLVKAQLSPSVNNSTGELTDSELKFNNRTAYLFLDYEYGIVFGVQNKTAQNEFLVASEKWYNATHALKANGRFPMIAYSQVQFTPGYPEFPPNKANKAFHPYVSANELLINSTQRNILSNVAPMDGDFVVQKRRFDAMFESTLPLLLQANLIDTVVLSGAYTSGVILATMRACSDMDYQIYIIRENVIDPSYSLSQTLLDVFFPQQASVISLETALKALPKSSHESKKSSLAYTEHVRLGILISFSIMVLIVVI